MATGLSPYAWRRVPVEAGAVDAVTAALADHEIADQLAAGPVVVVAGRANLAESGEAAAAALRAVLDACPGATVLPALRRGNVVGAVQLGLTPNDDGLDSTGILTAAAEGRGRPPRAARRRPARRLSPTPTWPAAPSPAPAG